MNAVGNESWQMMILTFNLSFVTGCGNIFGERLGGKFIPRASSARRRKTRTFTITTHLFLDKSRVIALWKFALMKEFLRCTNTRKLLLLRRTKEVRSTLIFVENMVHHSFGYNKHTHLCPIHRILAKKNTTQSIIAVLRILSIIRVDTTQSFGIFLLLHTPLILVHLRQEVINESLEAHDLAICRSLQGDHGGKKLGIADLNFVVPLPAWFCFCRWGIWYNKTLKKSQQNIPSSHHADPVDQPLCLLS